MQRCIQLALMGQGNVAPNPMVGAVIVRNGKIIGEGYHEKFGKAHAEVNAINTVEDKSVLSEATIYVSLEPCAHHGKTPPCADLIVSHHFKRVVIGCSDSFDQVSGKGVERIKNAGIDVTIGILEEKCRELNKHFFTYHEKKRPYIFLKWAQTPNGLMDTVNGEEGKVNWISVPQIQVLVHQWRSEHMAILVGKNTVIKDNPALTVRQVEGMNPIRVVLDSKCELTPTFKVFDNDAPTIVLNLIKSSQEDSVSYVQLVEMTPEQILKALYDREINSVFIEGGAKTLQSFIDANLWDEACIIYGQLPFEKGTIAPKIKHTPYRQQNFFGDTINYYSNS